MKEREKWFRRVLISISRHRFEIIDSDIMNDVSVFVLETISSKSMNLSTRDSFEASKFVKEKNTWKFAYEISIWFDDIYFFLKEQRQNIISSLIKRFFDYRVVKNILWIYREDYYLSCILEKRYWTFYKMLMIILITKQKSILSRKFTRRAIDLIWSWMWNAISLIVLNALDMISLDALNHDISYWSHTHFSWSI